MHYAKSTLLNTATITASSAGANQQTNSILPEGPSSPSLFGSYGLRDFRHVTYQSQLRKGSHPPSDGLALTRPENDWLNSDSDDSDLDAHPIIRPFEPALEPGYNSPRRTETSHDNGETLLPQPPKLMSSCSDVDDTFLDGLKSDYLPTASASPFRGDHTVEYEDFHKEAGGTPGGPLPRSSSCVDAQPRGEDPVSEHATVLSIDASVGNPIPSLCGLPHGTVTQEPPLSPRAFLNLGFPDVGSHKLLSILETKLSETRNTVATTWGHYSSQTNKLFASIETEIISAALSVVLPSFVPDYGQENDVVKRREPQFPTTI